MSVSVWALWFLIIVLKFWVLISMVSRQGSPCKPNCFQYKKTLTSGGFSWWLWEVRETGGGIGHSQLAIQIQQISAVYRITRTLYKLYKIQLYLSFSDISALADQISFLFLVSLNYDSLHYSSILGTRKRGQFCIGKASTKPIKLAICLKSLPCSVFVVWCLKWRSPGVETERFQIYS